VKLGNTTPVLLVHGFNEGPGVYTSGSPSLADAIKAALGSAVTTAIFDYHMANTDWVTSPAIGPQLAQCIIWLAHTSDTQGGPGKVIIVAHSMGGLAVRCAVDPTCVQNGGKGPAADPNLIGLVITLGTPNTGSNPQKFGPVVDTICSWFPDCNNLLILRNTPAAEAMAPSSGDLAALPLLPASIPVDAIAGDITFTTNLFGSVLNAVSPGFGGVGDDGDIVVPVASALADAEHGTLHAGPGANSTTVNCGSIPLNNIVAWGAASKVLKATVLPVTCWHLTETTDSVWQRDIIAAIQPAASALNLRACTSAAISAALLAKDPTNGATRTLVTYACNNGWALAEVHQSLVLNDGSTTQDTGVAILQQAAAGWSSEGLGDGVCLNAGVCPGYALPPPAVLHLLLQKAGISTATPACPNVTPPVPAVVIGPGCAKPTVLYFSSDQTVSIQGITWSSWNASGATGLGRWNLVDCNPNCAQGPITTHPATLTLSNVQNGLYTVLITTGSGPTTTWNYPDNWPQHT